jgi:phosphoribosylamine--glycine ligase
MNILVIGSGGREHAIAEAYTKNKKVKKVIVAPGNDFMTTTSPKITTATNISVFDFDTIINLAKKEKVDLVDVAQDDPLAEGLIDALQKTGIRAFGPTRDQAEIEWNKKWSRDFMKKYKLPIPAYKSFSDGKKAIAYIQSLTEQPLFIKAAGLAAGKGALRAENKKQAIDAIVAMKLFGKAGETFLIEECMSGEEFSLFAICDGNTYRLLGIAQDHKTRDNKDLGPNTGGMGCVAPTNAVTKSLVADVEKTIIKPFLAGMKKENRPYTGILYVGGMLTKRGVKMIEFNARWGDSEAEVILPSITSDYLTLVLSAIEKNLNKIVVKNDGNIRISISGASYGYPGDTSEIKGKKILGLDNAGAIEGVSLYGAGIKKYSKGFVANGGRIIHIVAAGKTIEEARKKGYAAMSQIYIEGNNLHYRTDIGWRELERNMK